jgi:hypothetical protein
MELSVYLQTSVARTSLSSRQWIVALLLAGCMVWRGT